MSRRKTINHLPTDISAANPSVHVNTYLAKLPATSEYKQLVKQYGREFQNMSGFSPANDGAYHWEQVKAFMDWLGTPCTYEPSGHAGDSDQQHKPNSYDVPCGAGLYKSMIKHDHDVQPDKQRDNIWQDYHAVWFRGHKLVVRRIRNQYVNCTGSGALAKRFNSEYCDTYSVTVAGLPTNRYNYHYFDEEVSPFKHDITIGDNERLGYVERQLFMSDDYTGYDAVLLADKLFIERGYTAAASGNHDQLKPMRFYSGAVNKAQRDMLLVGLTNEQDILTPSHKHKFPLLFSRFIKFACAFYYPQALQDLPENLAQQMVKGEYAVRLSASKEILGDMQQRLLRDMNFGWRDLHDVDPAFVGDDIYPVFALSFDLIPDSCSLGVEDKVKLGVKAGLWLHEVCKAYPNAHMDIESSIIKDASDHTSVGYRVGLSHVPLPLATKVDTLLTKLSTS